MGSLRSLEARLEQLERTAAPPDEYTFILSAINPGHLDSPRVLAKFYGQTLHRLHDESEEAFTSRAVEAAKAAKPEGCRLELSVHGAEGPHQWVSEGGALVARPVVDAEAA